MEPKRRRSPALERIRRWFPLVLLLVGWADTAVAQTPVSLFQSYLGRVNYVATGGSLRSQPNTVNACSLNATSSNNVTGIPAAATIRNAYLYWSGSGTTVDTSVTLNGNTVNASRTFTATFPFGGNNFDFFSGFADVTSIVTGNGNATFGGLTVNNGAPYCGTQVVLSGWGLIVVYEDPAEDLRAVNLYDGFQFFRGNSLSTTLTNFRVPTSPINGQVTHITWEGDPQNSGALSGFTESLTYSGSLLDDGLVPPGSNPAVQQFDGTVNTTLSITEYGVDVDTYNVSALLSPGDTSATTIYSAGADLVLLSAEVMSVTTEPFVDLTLAKTHVGDFTAGVNGDYTLTVGNNGSENDAGVTVTDTLPAGLTYLAFAGTNWNCGAVGQDVTCTHPGPLAAGASLPVLTVTVLPDPSGAPSVDNTATVTSLSLDSDPTNNTAVDTTVIRTSDLSTSTKGVVDLNGGDADPGDTLRYTITLTETGGFDALGVSVTDDMPGLVTGFTVGMVPPGAVDNSTGPGTGTNRTGFLDISNFTVLANSSATITFDVTVAAGANPGDIITNQAVITVSNGVGGNPVAPNVIVSQSQIPGGGAKTLYLYDLASADPNGFNEGPAPYLSRTPPAGAQNNVTVDRNRPPRIWTMTPATRLPLDIDSGSIPVTLYVSKGDASASIQTRTLQVALDTVGNTTGPLGTPVTLTFGAPSRNSPIPIVFNVPVAAPVSLATGTQIRITVTNQSPGAGNRRVRVYPISGGNFSRAELPALTVINVTDVTPYDVAFPGTSTPASFAPGSDVFLRAVVTDPFGSFDIARANLDLIDALGNPQLTGATMTLVDDDGAATRTYELSYTLLSSAASGTWTPRVTAIEGTEGLISSLLSGAFDVVSLSPDLVVLKTVVALSDPINGTTNPKAIPGAIMLYTLQVTNQGSGAVDPDTLMLSDVLPANSALFVDTGSGDPVVFVDGTPVSGLGYVYATDINFSSQVGGGAPYNYTPVPDPQGFDSLVTGLQITPSGPLAGSTGAGDPSFQLRFRVRID
jgi:uncharacterized repeat protein (TIGR01451 family)